MKEELKEPRVFKVNDENLKEVIPGALFMKHMFGADMSIALFKFAQGKGSEAPVEVHSHGEEIGLVLKGTARVNGTDGKEYVLKPGDAIIIPAGWEHRGTFDDEEDCVLFCVAYPKRTEDLGPEGETPAPVGFHVKET